MAAQRVANYAIEITRPTTLKEQTKKIMTPRSPKKPVERTIQTRNHPLTTSGSGQQNPVAPNNMEKYDNSSMADTTSTTRCEEAVGNAQQRESPAARIA